MAGGLQAVWSSGFAVPDIKLAIRFEENLLVPPRHGACTLGQKKCSQIDLLDAMPVDAGG